MPTRDGYGINHVIFDESTLPSVPTWDIASWYPSEMIVDNVPNRPSRIDWDNIKWYPTANFEPKWMCNFSTSQLLGKCRDCVSYYKRTDGVRVCLCSKNGKPNDETCNYERKKR